MLLKFVCVLQWCYYNTPLQHTTATRCNGAISTHHCNTLQQHTAATTHTRTSRSIVVCFLQECHGRTVLQQIRATTHSQTSSSIGILHHNTTAKYCQATATQRSTATKLLQHTYCNENAHTIPRQYRRTSAMHYCNTLHCCNNTHKAVLPHHCNTLLQHTTATNYIAATPQEPKVVLPSTASPASE